jgi:hypothetical protein
MSFKILPLFLFLLMVACEVRSQANLSVQGSIQNSSGIALADGKYSVVFRLYESESGGTPVWSETHPELKISGGLYSATLGLFTPLTASFDKPYFLGVSVGGSPELYPRAPLSSSPYALSLVGQDNVFPSAGTIGVGTKTPDTGSQLHLKVGNGPADVLLEGSENPEIVFKKGVNTATISFDGDKVNISSFTPSSGGIPLPAGATISYDGTADWRLVDTDDFENNDEGWVCHTAWNNTTPINFERKTLNTPFSRGFFLKTLTGTSTGNAFKKEFDLTGIPHTMVKVVFTYHMLLSWKISAVDYYYGFAGFATRANAQDNVGQSNGIFQLGWRKRAPGIENVLGVEGVKTHTDRMIANTTLDKFWVVFGSNHPGDEAFGISNIEIWVK